MESRLRTEFSEAVVREGADVLMLRAEEEGVLRTFIDTTDVGRTRTPAICQAIFQGVEGSEWETM